MIRLNADVEQLQKNINSLEQHPIQDADLTKYDIKHGTNISAYWYKSTKDDIISAALNGDQEYSSSIKNDRASCLKTDSCNPVLIEYMRELKDSVQDKISLIKDVFIPIFNGVMIILISGLIIFICGQCYVCWNSNRSK